MTTTAEHLAEFAGSLNYADLPDQVVHETKRLLLDSLGCALAGVTSEKGKWAVEFARTFFAGAPQATVLGVGDRMSALGAAFVNGELINGLDYDAAGRHLPPFVIPPALAAAEMRRSGGRDLITACALAHEVGIRMGGALGSHRDVVDGKVAFPLVAGHSAAIFGGTAAVAWLEDLSQDQVAQSIGLAAHISPGQVQATMVRNTPATTAKYLLAGWVSQAALTAAHLVKIGHRGDTSILDNDWGYWRYMAATRWAPETVTDRLGSDWRFIQATPVKLYPCCRIMHGALDCLAAVLAEHRIMPGEIEQVHAYLEASCVEPIFGLRDIETQVDAQFSVAYNIAVLASGIAPGARWQERETMRRPGVLELMKRVVFEPHPDYVAALQRDRNARLSRVEVSARGQVFTAESRFIRGTAGQDPASYITDAELIEKFKNNASLILPPRKVDAACARLMDLENVAEVAEVMGLLRL
ncbi:MAG TPA: MmgE/PrpD family protein [Trebonia sp.]|jgi:2-methylcitrate dehydratase PrpD|nr:MmgE/PrpD family protein [Trebonia sp.]